MPKADWNSTGRQRTHRKLDINSQTRDELKEEFRQRQLDIRLRKEVWAEVASELNAESAPEPYDFGPLIRGEASRPLPAFFVPGGRAGPSLSRTGSRPNRRDGSRQGTCCCDRLAYRKC